MNGIKIVIASQDSIQIQFPQKIDETVNSEIRNLVNYLKGRIGEYPEIEEIVPTYCAVTIYFDLSKCDSEFLINKINKMLSEIQQFSESNQTSGKIVEIPVCYEDEYSPDLKDVAAHTGLSADEIIKIHGSKDYLIYMLGFLPGFPYLGGVDERLETPRLQTPRIKIPAGSIALGGKQAGLYPSESPGGWRIIGRTPLKVFDQNRNPACLYETGDRIRFVKITKEEFLKIEKNYSNDFGKKSSDSFIQNERYVCTSGIRILDGGMLCTVQDSGRKGFQSAGIGKSGAMDFESFCYANYLLGNKKNAASIEATVLGPTIEFTLDCDFAITGGKCSATLDDQVVPMNEVVHAKSGSILKCGFVSKGLRTYIAFKGGILVPTIFGSRSTNLKSKMGGYFGRKLECGDEIAIGDFFEQYEIEDKKIFPVDIPGTDSELVLECTKGSQFDLFSYEKIKEFQKNIYTVLPESDRMGIRFDGNSLDCGKTDIISDAIPFGAVQITSAGLPVVMAADRQTTGGYAKIAAVTKHSMCQLAQAVPGTKVKFKII